MGLRPSDPSHGEASFSGEMNVGMVDDVCGDEETGVGAESREDESLAMMTGMASGVSDKDIVPDEEQFFKVCCRVYADHPYHYPVYRWLAGLSRNRRGLDKISAHLVAALNLYVDVLEGNARVVPISPQPMPPPNPADSPASRRLRAGPAYRRTTSSPPRRTPASCRCRRSPRSGGSWPTLSLPRAGCTWCMRRRSPSPMARSNRWHIRAAQWWCSRMSASSTPAASARR